MTVNLTTIETYTGRFFDVANPQAKDVCIDDIAHALGNLCRYGGHCKEFYSVAEHSRFTTTLAQIETTNIRMHKLCILHDAAEAYLIDVPRPVKAQLPAYEAIEKKAMSAIYEHFSLTPPTDEEKRFIKRMDNIALHTEAKHLMPSQGLNWGIPEQADTSFSFSFWMNISPKESSFQYKQTVEDIWSCLE